MPSKDFLRALAWCAFGGLLIAWNAPSLLPPEHRLIALLLIACGLSLALFVEMMARQLSLDWVLAGVAAVIGLAGLVWLGLRFFYVPLANDNAPLLPRRAAALKICPGALNAGLGDRWVQGGVKNFVPFRVGTCPGPSLTRTAAGLTVNAYGYDSSGTIIFRIQENRFTLLLGDYLHVHRPNRSVLGVYDKGEQEILRVDYLAPDTARIRGRFLCGDSAPIILAGGSDNGSSQAQTCLTGPLQLARAP